MALKKLRLNADSFEQLHPDDDPIQTDREKRRYTTLRRGDLFTPRDEQERDRLLESGAAEDPDEAHKRRVQELEQKKAQLDAEQKQLEAQKKDADAEKRDEQKQQSSSS